MKLTAGDTNILHAAFCIKVLCAGSLCSQFGLVIFCQKNISTKAAPKLLVKLATGDNFTFILWALYKSYLYSFYPLSVWLCNFFFERISLKKLLVKCWWNLGDNLINTLRKAFSCEIVLSSFSLLGVCVCIFWVKNTVELGYNELYGTFSICSL